MLSKAIEGANNVLSRYKSSIKLHNNKTKFDEIERIADLLPK